MSSLLRTGLCPLASLTAGAPDGTLLLSLTVPGEARSAGIVRGAISSALHAHALDRFALPAAHAVSELVAQAARLTPGQDVYVFLRHRDDVVRLVVWDQHPAHADPAAVTLCRKRRRRALWLLGAVVDDWGGEWGIRDAGPPQGGTKTWVALPS